LLQIFQPNVEILETIKYSIDIQVSMNEKGRPYNMQLEFRDLILIKVYFSSESVKNRKQQEFKKILEKYGITKKEAETIAKNFEF